MKKDEELITKPDSWPFSMYMDRINPRGILEPLTLAFSEKPVETGDVLFDRRTGNSVTCTDVYGSKENLKATIELPDESIEYNVPISMFYKIVSFSDKWN